MIFLALGFKSLLVLLCFILLKSDIKVIKKILKMKNKTETNLFVKMIIRKNIFLTKFLLLKARKQILVWIIPILLNVAGIKILQEARYLD